MKRNLDDYVDVATRIQRFYEKHPEGSLSSEIVTDDGTRIVVKAYAYRTMDDTAPATGHAEEIRGDGPVNKTSAVENAETSAVGRAIAMFGFEVRKGIASREEVEQARAEETRQAERTPHDASPEAEGIDANNRDMMEALGFSEAKIQATEDKYRTLNEKKTLNRKLINESEKKLQATLAGTA